MSDSRSFAIFSNEYLEPQDAASLSVLFSLVADGNDKGNLIGNSGVGMMADVINNQPGNQGGSNECTPNTNLFPNSRRRVRRGDLCRSGFLLTPDITKKDSNLPTVLTGQQVENGNEEATPSNGKKPSSEQEQKPVSQSTEKKDEPNKELCTDEGFKYAVCGPYLWAEQFGPPYRRRWNLEGCNPYVSPCQKPDELWCCEQVFPRNSIWGFESYNDGLDTYFFSGRQCIRQEIINSFPPMTGT